MAINIPIITSLEDSGIKAAKAAFGNFKASVADAEGGMGKFKAGAGAALDSVKANAGNFALAAGAAIVAFAGQSIKAFQDLALGAEKFATATGLAIQDASRYMEVAGDIGIPVDAVQTAIGRLNKTIGADPDKVRNLGVDLVYLKDGSLDVNATFLNTIERIKGIKDPAEKAKVAAELLGKGWQSMSTLIEMGADDLSTALGDVSDSKVIDPEELEKAKKFRELMDKLSDAFDDIKLIIAEALIPVLNSLADAFQLIKKSVDWIFNLPGVSQLVSLFGKLLHPIELVQSAIGSVEDAWSSVSTFFGSGPMKENLHYFEQKFGDGLDEASDSTDRFSDVVEQGSFNLDKFVAIVGGPTVYFKTFKTGVDDITEALVNADTAWKTLTGNLDREVALDNAKNKLKELEDAAKRAFGSGAQADIDAYDQAAADFVGSLEAIAGGMSDISSKQILIRYKTEGPAAALELANYLARGAEYGGLSAVDALNLAGISTLPKKANGGPVMSGTTYLVGEQGPELFTPSSSGNITPNHAMGGGSTITVNVNGGDPDAVVRAIQKYARQNGAIPLQTTTSARF
ncbi:hypothetical protein UFOVP364_9 [uncultured Caudovirales phage]|uniref:Bacteriophage lambda, GpH, tail tape measure, C-terminal n=1 Tax=uncultured Caudovirales phage TaxID=2100421 RepID=A0A6J7WZ10_9CAUD|nr:hypothetical protein UFOVP364_9 [uncultured Caudovirales phage]